MRALLAIFSVMSMIGLSTQSLARETVLASCGTSNDRNFTVIENTSIGGDGSVYAYVTVESLLPEAILLSSCVDRATEDLRWYCSGTTEDYRAVRVSISKTHIGDFEMWIATGSIIGDDGSSQSLGAIQPCDFFQ